MFGFVVGTLSLVGLIWVVRGRHRHGFRHRHGRRRRMLHWIFEELGTSPGQERVIRSALDDLEQELGGLKREMRDARSEFGGVLGGEQFDQAAVDQLFSRAEAGFERLRNRVTENLRTIHEVLDPNQRQKFQSLFDRWSHHVHGGPYRSAC
jgi:Spy/CpxP family protein refolding chaperone